VSISSDVGTDSTKSDGEYDSEQYTDVDMHMQDDVGSPYGIDSDGDVDMERDGDYEEEEDEEEDDKEEDDEQEEDKDEEDEEEEEDEDEDEDDGKEPQTISQGEMVNTSVDDVDTMVDDQPIVLPEQGQEWSEHTPHPQPRAPAPWPQTPKPWTQPRMPETHPSVGWKIWDLWCRKNLAQRCQVYEKLREPETPQMWMWISRCSAKQQLATVSQISSPRHTFPQCASPWGVPGWLVRWEVKQSSHCRGGDGCCVRISVRFLSCSFPMF